MSSDKEPLTFSSESKSKGKYGCLPENTNHTGSEIELNRRSEDNGEVDTSGNQSTEEPEKQDLSLVSLILLNLTWYACNLMYLVISIVVVPAQIQVMVGGKAKGRWLGGIVAIGAVLTFALGPILGLCSDRLSCKFGKRRPIIVVATILLCTALLGMALSSPKFTIHHPLNVTKLSCGEIDLVERRCAPYKEQETVKVDLSPAGARQQYITVNESKNGNFGLFIACYLLSVVALSGVHVPYTALLADLSPPNQRGSASGVMGGMILLGNISGAAVAVVFVDIGIKGVYGLVIGVLLACVLVTVLTIREEPSLQTQGPLDVKEVVFAYYNTLKEHDFRWVFFTRFLMQQGLSTTIGFLEYWLGDVILLPGCMSPQRAVGIVLMPLLMVAAIFSVLAGYISDKTKRRKPIVMGAAVLMSFMSVIFAGIRGPWSFYGVLFLSLVFGIGYGSYMSVDFALLMDILPEEKDKAKDIAIWSQALILPQVLATPIGGVLLDIFEYVKCEIGLGYIILFAVTAVYFFLSAIFVSKIRKVQ